MCCAWRCRRVTYRTAVRVLTITGSTRRRVGIQSRINEAGHNLYVSRPKVAQVCLASRSPTGQLLITIGCKQANLSVQGRIIRVGLNKVDIIL